MPAPPARVSRTKTSRTPRTRHAEVARDGGADAGRPAPAARPDERRPERSARHTASRGHRRPASRSRRARPGHSGTGSRGGRSGFVGRGHAPILTHAGVVGGRSRGPVREGSGSTLMARGGPGHHAGAMTENPTQSTPPRRTAAGLLPRRHLRPAPGQRLRARHRRPLVRRCLRRSRPALRRRPGARAGRRRRAGLRRRPRPHDLRPAVARPARPPRRHPRRARDPPRRRRPDRPPRRRRRPPRGRGVLDRPGRRLDRTALAHPDRHRRVVRRRPRPASRHPAVPRALRHPAAPTPARSPRHVRPHDHVLARRQHAGRPRVDPGRTDRAVCRAAADQYAPAQPYGSQPGPYGTQPGPYGGQPGPYGGTAPYGGRPTPPVPPRPIAPPPPPKPRRRRPSAFVGLLSLGIVLVGLGLGAALDDPIGLPRQLGHARLPHRPHRRLARRPGARDLRPRLRLQRPARRRARPPAARLLGGLAGRRCRTASATAPGPRCPPRARTSFELGAGDATLDLGRLDTDVARTTPQVISVEMGAGDLTILVPAGPRRPGRRERRHRQHPPRGRHRRRRQRVHRHRPVAPRPPIGDEPVDVIVDAQLGLGEITIQEQ